MKPAVPPLRRVVRQSTRPHLVVGQGPAEQYRMLWLLLILASICAHTTSAAEPAASRIPETASVEILPVADQLLFAKAVENAVQNGNISVFNELIDWNQIADVATQGESAPAETRSEFKNGVVGAALADKGQRFAGLIVKNTQQGGTYKFLHLGEVDHAPIATFRLYFPGKGGTNYHRFFLRRSADGVVRAADVYLFLTAERFTEKLAGGWRATIDKTTKDRQQKLTTPLEPTVATTTPLRQMQKLIADGEPEKALVAYRNFPEKVRQEKAMLALRFHATKLFSLDEYQSAIEDYRRFYPNDPALDFLSIDGFTIQKQFDKVLLCIDRVNQSVGGDAYLVSSRGLTLLSLQRIDEARETVRQAIGMEPDFAHLYWNAVYVSLMTRHFDDVPDLLDTIEQIEGQPIGDLKSVPLYADFMKSPEYAKWMETRKSR